MVSYDNTTAAFALRRFMVTALNKTGVMSFAYRSENMNTDRANIPVAELSESHGMIMWEMSRYHPLKE